MNNLQVKLKGNLVVNDYPNVFKILKPETWYPAQLLDYMLNQNGEITMTTVHVRGVTLDSNLFVTKYLEEEPQ